MPINVLEVIFAMILGLLCFHEATLCDVYVCLSCISNVFIFFCYSDILFSKCQGGVQRVHIIDGTVGGSLLLELFTRDGVGTMIARSEVWNFLYPRCQF